MLLGYNYTVSAAALNGTEPSILSRVGDWAEMPPTFVRHSHEGVCFLQKKTKTKKTKIASLND